MLPKMYTARQPGAAQRVVCSVANLSCRQCLISHTSYVLVHVYKYGAKRRSESVKDQADMLLESRGPT